MLIKRFAIDRVLADPDLVWEASSFSCQPRYIRLHGKPKIYHSSYSPEDILSILQILAPSGWCVFDNTASGAAIKNALAMAKNLNWLPK